MTETTTPLAVNATDLTRIMSCIGSIYMPASPAPSLDDNTTRKEGDAVHWLVNQLQHGVVVEVNDAAPNGVKITSTMMEHVAGHLSIVEQFGTGQTEVDCTFEDHLGKFRVDARADRIIWTPDTATLHVIELKYGWSIVEPEENWPMIAYAVGYMRRFNVTPVTVYFTVHQPRPWHSAGTIRTCQIGFNDLIVFADKMATLLRNPRASTFTGPHCRRCPSNALCAAARKAALNAVEVADAAHREDIPGDALSAELDLLTRASKAIEDRLKAVKELAAHRIKQGQIVPNYSNEISFSNRRWINPDPATLSAIVGVDLVEKASAVSPAEAERRGVSKEVVQALTEKVSTGTRLVRMELDTKARKMFK